MGFLTPWSYVKLHAVFQLTLAIYLTHSREVITDSELVYRGEDENLRIDTSSTFKRSRSPFAYCGILLVIFALIDLTLAFRLCTLNHLLPLVRYLRNLPSPSRSTRAQPNVRKVTAEITELFHQLTTFLMTLRVTVFLVVAARIINSPPQFWTAAAASVAAPSAQIEHATDLALGMWMDINSSGMGMATDLVASVEDLKCKVILVYAVMEALFSAWVIRALYDEQSATEKRFPAASFRPRLAQEEPLI